MSALPVVRTVADLRRVVAGWRAEGLRVALTPTMGAAAMGGLMAKRGPRVHPQARQAVR